MHAFGGGGGRRLPPEMEAAAAAKQAEFEAALKAEEARSHGGGGGRHIGPKVEVCYICGREFGSASIRIHEKNCAKKWEEIEAQKPVRDRRPLPQRPDVTAGATREERNEAARATHEAEVMAQCEGCGRKFKDEATLLRHQKGCHVRARAGTHGSSSDGARDRQLSEFEATLASSPEHEGGNLKKERSDRGAGSRGGGSAAPGPRLCVCYICGREFGTSSIGIHEKQCAKKWEDVEARKPAHERKALPQRPDMEGDATREEINEAALEIHKSQVMEECPQCGRTFKDSDTLQRHQRGCSGKASKRAGRHAAVESRVSLDNLEDLLTKLFNVVDVDSSGIIDSDEITAVLHAFGTVGEMMGFKVDYSFESMDTDHSGGVDPAEFEHALMPMEEIFGPRKCAEVMHALIQQTEANLKGESDGSTPKHRPAHRQRITDHASVPKDVVPCPNCSRNFNPESLAIHLRSCGGAHGTSRILRSQLEGGTRQQRDAEQAMHLLLQTSAHDSTLAARMRATFKKVDMNGNGTLDREEFEVVYKTVHLPTSKPSLDELMEQYDANHDGKLQFAEFERLMHWALRKR